jgi:hypothetical protein
MHNGPTSDTIASVIEAWGKGEIRLEDVDPKAPKHSIHVAPGGATYTIATVSKYLGWTKGHGKQDPQPTHACRIAFDAFHESSVTKAAMEELPPWQPEGGGYSAPTPPRKSTRGGVTEITVFFGCLRAQPGGNR